MPPPDTPGGSASIAHGCAAYADMAAASSGCPPPSAAAAMDSAAASPARRPPPPASSTPPCARGRAPRGCAYRLRRGACGRRSRTSTRVLQHHHVAGLPVHGRPAVVSAGRCGLEQKAVDLPGASTFMPRPASARIPSLIASESCRRRRPCARVLVDGVDGNGLRREQAGEFAGRPATSPPAALGRAAQHPHPLDRLRAAFPVGIAGLAAHWCRTPITPDSRSKSASDMPTMSACDPMADATASRHSGIFFCMSCAAPRQSHIDSPARRYAT